MCVANTQINRIYQRKHEILRLWEGGARGFGLGHSNADFVHLIQQAEFFKNMLLMAALNKQIFHFFQYVKMKLKPQQIRHLCLFFNVNKTILLKADLLSIML